MSALGDFDGDGFDDILIGAPEADPPGADDTGQSYVVFGGNFINAVDFFGGTANVALAGTAGADVMIGGQGDNRLDGFGGADVLKGGAGNDLLVVTDLNFQRIEGDSGTDTLVLEGTGLNLDLTATSNLKITGVEKIDLTGFGNNSLTLNLQDVLDISETSNALTVLGDTGDTVNATANTWTNAGSVGGFTTYTLGAASLILDDDLTQNVFLGGA